MFVDTYLYVDFDHAQNMSQKKSIHTHDAQISALRKI